MNRRVLDVLGRIRQTMRVPYFGFVGGHAHLTEKDLSELERWVGVESSEIVAEFETSFTKLIGNGQTVSYAAGRMGFYDLMRNLGIGDNDEVILLGATCVVMVNAVIRAGAKPIFSDIDPNTFGSVAGCIEACLSPKTQMIVAQHSFGIPCDIKPIVELARAHNIFLLEDCALTLGSKIDDVIVGNFGDAALFSIDHSKPLNVMTGGLVYTNDTKLARMLRDSRDACGELPLSKQQALFTRLRLERCYCVPSHQGRIGLIDLIGSVKKRLLNAEDPFLSDDFHAEIGSYYPYPAKLPSFLAVLGLMEVTRWPIVSTQRIALLRRLLDVSNKVVGLKNLPSAYCNERLQIVPLRFAWFQPDGDLVRQSIQSFVQVSWTWFLKPIIATSGPLESFGYRHGSCPVLEKIGPLMVNIPCNIRAEDADKLVELIRKSFYENVF